MYFFFQTLMKVSHTPTILHPVGLKQQNVTALFVPPSRVSNSCPELESHTCQVSKMLETTWTIDYQENLH